MPHPDMNASWVNGHPDEGALHEWLDEQLSATDANAIAAHVAACHECAALVAEARGLIAASHRILSALDDVPANVIPGQTSSAAADKAVVSLESARESANARSVNQSSRHSSRWVSVGKIAALLIVAIIPGFMLLRGDDVTVPLSLPKDVRPADSSAGAAASVASEQQTGNAAARALTAPAPVPAAAAAATVGAATAAGGRQSVARDLQKSAEPERAPSQPPAATAAETDRRMATAQSAAITLSDSNASASRRAPNIPAAPLVSAAAPVALPAATPPVMADQVAQAQRTAGGSGGAGGGRGAAFRKADSVIPAPIPQMTNAAGAPVASRPRGDTASVARDIADVARRIAGAAAAADSTGRRLPPMAARAANPALELRAAESRRVAFDSLTLSRTLCATACETAVLHISNRGDVRYEVSSGSTARPTVAERLAPDAQQRIAELLGGNSAQSAPLAGPVRCIINRATGAPELEIVVANRAMAQARSACTWSDEALRRLGAAIDSVVGTEALRRRMR